MIKLIIIGAAAFMILVSLIVAYAGLVVASDCDDEMEKRNERLQ